MKKAYYYFSKVEEFLACLLLISVVTLVFASALFRTAGHPLNWSSDIAQLLFAWSIFFGVDLSMREKSLIKVDMLLQKLPVKARKYLQIIWQIVIIVFLISLIVYGIPLCINSIDRKFSNMNLSYSWATASVPVGSILLTITSVVNLVKMFKSEDGTYAAEGGKDLC
ncbi:MAG: TRAP transporter small permease [Epulopiscium sp.]|uniref:TRAP transporter small permease subunit n=1 Tax=Defluviitalea raffinosedens TaxID=1450156 RepID=A0A7C8LKL5_9FIRM|nr:TRAP transporter small permease [Defluviitalea raffinosedens]KAE9634024.1 TRAP transporter small permease subunit [Defluviitalea raffinosedens]NLK97881.1 TRAP transporter small permease [Candidatus Epulonipiscium sp.]